MIKEKIKMDKIGNLQKNLEKRNMKANREAKGLEIAELQLNAAKSQYENAPLDKKAKRTYELAIREYERAEKKYGKALEKVEKVTTNLDKLAKN